MTNKLIVSKFGGSSVKNGQAMLYCSSIIENNSDIKVAIISATYNTTNQLELLAKLSKQSDLLELENLIKVIEIKHFDIAKELFSSNETYDGLKTLIEELRSISQCILDLKDFTPEIMDHLYGLGEQMSSLIFFDLLKLRLPERKIIKIKASDFIITNSDFNKAEPDLLKINEKVQSLKLLIKSDPKILIVTEGFIGKDKNSRPTTLGREGSDYSAALFGEALEADLIQIWTDVNGIYSSGPNIIENAFQIPNLTYAEATALATNGAKVLFPRTLKPAERKSIPVFVGKSQNPLQFGTLIQATQGLPRSNISKLKACATLENKLTFVGEDLNNEELIAKLTKHLMEISSSFQFINSDKIQIQFENNQLTSKEILSAGHRVLIQLK